MVLRIHVVRDGGHAYYVDDLVPGRAEGTLVAGEEPGRWWGAGAPSMGQSGRVDTQPFAEVLAGRDPVSGAPLRAPRARRSVSAYDLTFCAPKSVSLVHLLAPREMAEESGVAHRAAVDEALGYLERSALGVRRVRTGVVTRLPATGMVAGVFLHRTSRALDPHLHSHAVVANLAQGVDGQWSAVDSRRVFAHAQSAQAVYHARLRLELGERLGGACRGRCVRSRRPGRRRPRSAAALLPTGGGHGRVPTPAGRRPRAGPLVRLVSSTPPGRGRTARARSTRSGPSGESGPPPSGSTSVG